MQNNTWNNIIGHKSSIEQLQMALKNKRVPHALLLSGSEGIGKRLVAQALATALITKNSSLENSAEMIALIEAGNHPDLHFVYKEEEKKDLSVEIIRNICSKIKLKPYYPNCSVAIIDNAHQMNLSAFNSLLMTLEEPCDESYIILISHQNQRIPETILSRCQTVFFNDLNQEDLSKILTNKFNLEKKAAYSLLNICLGSLANLELAEFINPTTLKPILGKPLAEHFASLINFANSVSKDINQWIDESLNKNSSLQDAILIATKLKEQENSKLLWQIINNVFRENLKTRSANHIHKLSSLLLQAINSEKLVHERNLNQDLHLSSLFICASQYSL